jgi:hypothetical protein
MRITRACGSSVRFFPTWQSLKAFCGLDAILGERLPCGGDVRRHPGTTFVGLVLQIAIPHLICKIVELNLPSYAPRSITPALPQGCTPQSRVTDALLNLA